METRQDDCDQTHIVSGSFNRNGIASHDIAGDDESEAEAFISYISADFSEGVFSVGFQDTNAFCRISPMTRHPRDRPREHYDERRDR